MTEALKLRHLLDEHHVSEVQIGRGGIEPRLDHQRLLLLVALLEPRAVEEIRRRLDLQIERRAQHADFDVQAASGSRALEQRRERAERQQGRAVLIDHRRADGGRRLVRAPRDRRQAGDALHQEILAGTVAIRA